MRRKDFLHALVVAAATAWAPPRARAADDSVAVIANAPLRGLDIDALKRIYTGRTIEIDGQALRPVNLPPGSPPRQRFLARVLLQDEDDYVAYWTVRRYIGKGAPPRELRNAAEVIDFVVHTPGALGYIDAADLRPGLNVVFRR